MPFDSIIGASVSIVFKMNNNYFQNRGFGGGRGGQGGRGGRGRGGYMPINGGYHQNYQGQGGYGGGGGGGGGGYSHFVNHMMQKEEKKYNKKQLEKAVKKAHRKISNKSASSSDDSDDSDDSSTEDSSDNDRKKHRKKKRNDKRKKERSKRKLKKQRKEDVDGSLELERQEIELQKLALAQKTQQHEDTVRRSREMRKEKEKRKKQEKAELKKQNASDAHQSTLANLVEQLAILNKNHSPDRKRKHPPSHMPDPPPKRVQNKKRPAPKPRKESVASSPESGEFSQYTDEYDKRSSDDFSSAFDADADEVEDAVEDVVSDAGSDKSESLQLDLSALTSNEKVTRKKYAEVADLLVDSLKQLDRKSFATMKGLVKRTYKGKKELENCESHFNSIKHTRSVTVDIAQDWITACFIKVELMKVNDTFPLDLEDA